MSESDDLPGGEFDRRKIKVQLGDGPDARGEVTIESVREIETEDLRHGAFADWKGEVDRCVGVLEEKLDLEAPEEDDA